MTTLPGKLVLLLFIIIVFWISRSFSLTLRSTFSQRFVESYDFISRGLCRLHTDYAYALLQHRGAELHACYALSYGVRIRYSSHVCRQNVELDICPVACFLHA